MPQRCLSVCAHAQSCLGKYRVLAIVQVLAAAAAWSVACCVHGASGQFNREDLRPGVVGIHRDGGGNDLVQLDAAVALTLSQDESLHPRLAVGGAVYRWEGYLNVFRPSEYIFSALLRGKLRVQVDGKEVLSGDAKADPAALVSGAPVKLAAGAYPFVAEFVRLPGAARLELFWESPLFIKEPLNVGVLRHLPAKAPKKLQADEAVERGRFWVEELNCLRCHKTDESMARGLQWRQAPDLTRVGERIHSGWLAKWLDDPHQLSATAVMPRVFGDDPASRKDLSDAVNYLESLGGPMKADPKTPGQDAIQRGGQLFGALGCAVCHPTSRDKQEIPDANRIYGLVDPITPYREFKLADQAGKTTPARLAAYLRDPEKFDPSGRMPHLRLDVKDSQALAAYLCLGAGPAPKVSPTKAPADADSIRRGKAVVAARGCLSCHTLNDGGTPAASTMAASGFSTLLAASNHDRGCLATEPTKRGKAPFFTQTVVFPAIRQFLLSGAKTLAPSPPHAARVALQRFNCLACHTRDGEGGLSPDAVAVLRKTEKAENAEAIVPPTLTGVGHKLRTGWFQEVLTAGGQSRPWMSLRMPQFGKSHVSGLPLAITALEGTTTDDRATSLQASAETIAVGRQLIGKNNGYGCVTCHDIAGIPNSGTRGPDLARTTEHVRYDWYRRWLESAQRMDPGTKMPSIILDGRVMLDNVLGGHADRQAEAMWAYMSLGQRMPLPTGITVAKGMVLAVAERPVILRTFMPPAGNATRSIAVGFPGGVSTAFDAGQCRETYSWVGGFLDASPVWANRGGNPAKILGSKFWSSPTGFPWLDTGGKETSPPDFAAQAKDPAFGASLPEGVVFRGQKRLFFQGYTLDSAGQPIFDYRFTTAAGKSIHVTEQPGALYHGGSVGLDRRFNVDAVAGTHLWLHVADLGVAADKIQVVDRKGKTVAADDKSVAAGVGIDRVIAIPDTAGRSLIFGTFDGPTGARWHLQPQANGYQLLIELPPAAAPQAMSLAVRVWSVNGFTPAMAAELMGAKQ
jgi:mono/diheme cytochrome c family protein